MARPDGGCAFDDASDMTYIRHIDVVDVKVFIYKQPLCDE